ncbi:molybdate ABC transporter ATP-binding protein ModF [Geomonas terrae]|uniref:Molybdate ABC transporter ATP-binding protein ModF n=1 Tax=Geomonas terrae TaxID=2562681 RepID=A0A4S1CBD4_9BACT|nr:molybdate ABC transporter ATP-binding protein ModF [Geomonas terrae]TGU70631.1 molybdate ABC transporter ATP-binding protein ModF [Geomonas terrae]
MVEIRLEKVKARITEGKFLEDITLEIARDQHWAVVGANGSGKSAMGKLLCNGLPVLSGTSRVPVRSAYVSFEKIDEILEVERYNDDSDFLGYVTEGTRVDRFILAGTDADEARLAELAQELGFTKILERGIKFLSTGEMRKALICKALLQDPELLVLDEPFDGLDRDSSAVLKQLISSCIERGTQVVLLLNRFSEIVAETTHIAYIKECRIFMSGEREEMLASEALRRFHAFHYTLPAVLPEVDTARSVPPLVPGEPLIDMKNVSVRYGEKQILRGVTWTVREGEHWKISGPNGSGKSTLLSLISGDNPQAYANDISLFGRKKGSGESVWDIKKRIGLVSTSLQQEYRVAGTVKVAVISGMYDSIGMYSQYTLRQQEIALEWLDILHMGHRRDHAFRDLSYGEQRLVLLARAMVKQPDLLILDEPCQGLDDVNREMVLKLIDHLGRTGDTQILYVNHNFDDRIPCITNSMELVPAAGGGYTAAIG